MPFAFPLVFVVCLSASLLGPLCGIGGGVIIKPVFDSLGILPVAVTSFLSSVSVFTMALATCIQNRAYAPAEFDARTMVPVAIGSAIGGVFGKAAFIGFARPLSNPDAIGALQAAILIALSATVFVYTLRKAQISPHIVRSRFAKMAIGCASGACWAFLGIGGGPFNLALLSFFFAMDSRDAARASIVIILFSQAAAIIFVFASGGVPEVRMELLATACLAAVVGSVIGKRLSRKMNTFVIDRLYLVALVLIALLSCLNMMRFVL